MINHIREHRSRMGLRQEQLARAIGIARPSLSAIENGRFTPSTELALRMALVLQVSVEQLFELEKDEQPKDPLG